MNYIWKQFPYRLTVDWGAVQINVCVCKHTQKYTIHYNIFLKTLY